MEKETKKNEEKNSKELKENTGKKEQVEITNIGIEISADAVASIVAVELDKIKGIDRQGNLFTDISEAFRTTTKHNKRYKSRYCRERCNDRYKYNGILWNTYTRYSI